MTSQADSNICDLLEDKEQVSRDMMILQRYVKESLFYRVIFIVKEKEDVLLAEGGKMHNDFYVKNVERVCRGELPLLALNARKAYMNMLWKILVEKKKLKEWLAAKRSNCYTACQHRFNGMCSISVKCHEQYDY